MRRLLAGMLAIASAASVARAEPAPTFTIDLRSDDLVADKITEALEAAVRDVGAAKGARYRAKGTHKDRVAASTGDCPSALTTACAAEIGARLDVDYVLAGQIQTRGGRFELSLHVVNVATKKRVRSLRDLVATTTSAKAWAKQIFERVVDKATGSLAISCSVSRALVLIDGQPATELYQQHGLVTGIGLGRHAIEVRAAGYRSYADDVIIDGDNRLSVLLDAAP